MDKYKILTKKGEGTFSEVIKCQTISDGSFVAIKRMKGKFQSQEQVDNLREVQALKRLNPHPNIIKLIEVIFEPKQKTLDIVCELMDMNLYERIRGRKHHLPDPVIKSYMYQLCKALDHMHRNGIFHRDIKPENVLLRGEDVIKLADFGSCRGVYSKPPYTEYISTRWYRAPECLLTDGYYTYKMDIWSVGCVFFEIMALYPIFPGANELDQIAKIHDILGTPNPALLAKIRKQGPSNKFNFPAKTGGGIAKLLPQSSPECLDLLIGMLLYDPEARFSARQCVKHPYFKDLRDAEKRARALAATLPAMAVGSPQATPPATPDKKVEAADVGASALPPLQQAIKVKPDKTKALKLDATSKPVDMATSLPPILMKGLGKPPAVSKKSEVSTFSFLPSIGKSKAAE